MSAAMRERVDKALTDWCDEAGVHGPYEGQVDLVTRLVLDERERCARSVDTPCGVDADPKGMTCAPIKPGGRVYHDPGCGRRDADDIREGDDA